MHGFIVGIMSGLLAIFVYTSIAAKPVCDARAVAHQTLPQVTK